MADREQNFSKIFINFVFFTLFGFLIIGVQGVHSLLKRVQPGELTASIRASRHSPVCVLFRGEEKEKESRLEEQLVKFLERRKDSDPYSWEFVSFESKKLMLNNVPSSLPGLRCYLGYAVPFDYSGKLTHKGLKKWFRKLALKYHDQLPEASLSIFQQKRFKKKFLLIGFPGPDQHYELEEIFYELQDKWRTCIEVYFVHPHSLELKELMTLFTVTGFPSAVFVEVKANGDLSIVKVMEQHNVEKLRMNVFIAAITTGAVQFNMTSFEEKVLTPYRNFVPVVVYIYGFWTPHSASYLTMYQRAVSHFSKSGIHLRFSLIDAYEEQNIINKYFDSRYAAELPILMLYYPVWMKHNENLVKDLVRVVTSGKRPSAHAVTQLLKKSGYNFQNRFGYPYVFQEVETAVFQDASEVFEGPHGTMCSLTYHNLTDNYPVPLRVKPKVRKLKKKKIAVKRKLDDWHYLYGTEKIEKKLKRYNGTKIPLLSDYMWIEVIEKSHAPFHPFISKNKWAGEVTKTTLVVYIKVDCGSCRRHFNTFQTLHKSVGSVTGASMYIVNCTQEAHSCKKNGVTGFPTIQAFRGLGWLSQDSCISRQVAQQAHGVRMNYHGVLKVSIIMEWFSKIAAPAVTNVGFDSYNLGKEDVHLVASLMPKASKFVPLIPMSQGGTGYLYPYTCFRLVCERLFGRVRCKSRYTSSIPAEEFKDEDQDMVISEVLLERSDGVSAMVMEMMRPLVDTMEDKHDEAVHRFHKPHRYNLVSGRKCEDDHAFCTDVLVNFTVDHGRLAVHHIDEAYFHMGSGNLLVPEELPALVALVHTTNITKETTFMKTLTDVAMEYYNDISIVILDVDQYPSWVGQFVPKDYQRVAGYQETIPELYYYPRLCIIRWNDHHHAAFHPPVNITSMLPESLPYEYPKDEIIEFIKKYLKSADKIVIETEVL